jgi:hypothetical protein
VPLLKQGLKRTSTKRDKGFKTVERIEILLKNRILNMFKTWEATLIRKKEYPY